MDCFDGSCTNLRSQLKAFLTLFPSPPAKQLEWDSRVPIGAYEILPHCSIACQDPPLLFQLNQIPGPEDVYRKDSFWVDIILTARPR